MSPRDGRRRQHRSRNTMSQIHHPQNSTAPPDRCPGTKSWIVIPRHGGDGLLLVKRDLVARGTGNTLCLSRRFVGADNLFGVERFRR